MEAVAAAHLRRVAEQIVVPGFGTGPGNHRWTSHTQVHTEDDARAGAALHELFAASFPEHGLVIEDREVVPGDGRHEWLIDPIDGSANHLRGIPYVSMTAGLRVDGEPVVGVVHDVVRDTTLGAHAGGGTTVHHGDPDPPLRVAPTRRLADAMTIVHLARRGPLMGRPGALATLLWGVRKIRCMGSIALDLALLARGEGDLLVVGRGRPQRQLDIAGGLVLLAEAGGAAMTARGEPFTDDSFTLVAGPRPLCEELVELMADHDLEGWTADQCVPPA